jgi:hypothetical protein
MVEVRLYLNVPHADKEAAKKLGARWDAETKGWWIPSTYEREEFLKWLPRMYRPGVKPPHLTCEMVPVSTWYQNLRDWLPKEEWDRIRKSVYQQAGNRCQVCGGRGPKWPVECNEQWQYLSDRNLRLTALCPLCHSVKHIGLANIRGRLAESVAQLGFVNGWNEAACNTHLAQAQSDADIRNNIVWSFDLTNLKNYDVASLEIDLALHEERPVISGIAFSYKNIASYFDRIAARRNNNIAKQIANIWPRAKWQRLKQESLLWACVVQRDDGQIFRFIDCTTPLNSSNQDLSILRTDVAEATASQQVVVILSKSSHPYENDVALRETVDGLHGYYLRVEFISDDFQRIVAIDDSAREMPFTAFVGSVANKLRCRAWKQNVVLAAEFVRTDCWACKKQIYRLTGVVLPASPIADWQSDDWKYRSHFSMHELSVGMRTNLVSVLHGSHKHAGIGGTFLKEESGWTMILCPYCTAEQRQFEPADDSARMNALHDLQARSGGKLIYSPLNIPLDYETARLNYHSFEASSFSTSETNQFDWLY